MNKDDQFKQLVENAMDFLSRSIDEFKEYPKYSLIHFHTAVELFLKSRLMAEHWTLVVSKRGDPDWEKFIVGNFKSVTLSEAVDRLNKIVRSGFSGREIETFKKLTTHRNKMVHFFHESDSTEGNKMLREAIAKEQLTIWYLLHKSLTGRWSNIFSSWSDDLNVLDARLRTHRRYLQVVFDQLSSDIEKWKLLGYRFRNCSSCEFLSQKHINKIGELYEAECIVCSFTENCIMMECPECEQPFLFRNEGFGECENCRLDFDPEFLAEELVDDNATYIATKEGDDTWMLGNCNECDGFHTVIRLGIEGDKYLCTSCFGEFDSVRFCNWCNELNTGDMADSYWFGCSVCDGKGLD